jgi:hypothetical protein
MLAKLLMLSILLRGVLPLVGVALPSLLLLLLLLLLLFVRLRVPSEVTKLAVQHSKDT